MMNRLVILSVGSAIDFFISRLILRITFWRRKMSRVREVRCSLRDAEGSDD